MKAYENINSARFYYSELWKRLDTNSEIIKLEKHWGEQGKLELLRTPIPSRDVKIRTRAQNYKQSKKKHYNHLGMAMYPSSWAVPTQELEDKEDDYIAVNYDF